MNEIRFTVDAERAIAALTAAPEAMERHLALGLDQGALVVAQAARRLVSASDVTANLKNSIRVESPEPLRREVVAASDHARFVEEGTGVFAGRPRYFPNPDALLEYLKAHPRSRGFAFGAAAQRPTQELELWHRSRAWALAIYARGGTRPHPFMRPAREQSEARVRQVMRQAVQAGIVEVFGAG